MQPLLCAAGVVGPALGAAAAGLCKWLVGGAVLPVCGEFQRRSHYSATTAHRDLPVRRWPALGMPWGTASSNAASAVCSRIAGGGLNWGLRQGWAGGLWGLRCCQYVEIPRGGGSTRQPQRTAFPFFQRKGGEKEEREVQDDNLSKTIVFLVRYFYLLTPSQN